MPYVADGNGRQVPVHVDRCSVGEPSESCKLSNHAWRSRLTGPEHDLCIMCCGVHRVFFTLYPPGFTPYARRRLAPVDESCEPVPAEPGREVPEENWRGTFFDAALDAAAGQRWLRDDEPGPCSKPLYATQVRWLVRLERLFGLGREQFADVVEGIRQRLGLSLTEHARARREATASRRLQTRGQALVLLAAVVAMDGELWARLLGAGHLAELWAEPWLWDPIIRQFEFPCHGTRVPRRPRGP